MSPPLTNPRLLFGRIQLRNFHIRTSPTINPYVHLDVLLSIPLPLSSYSADETPLYSDGIAANQINWEEFASQLGINVRTAPSGVPNSFP
jgi:hypothetical protein